VKKCMVLGALAAAVSMFACSAAPPEESVSVTEEAFVGCPLGDASLCPPRPQPTPEVVGTWDRHVGSLTETLDLRADGTYSLSEVVAPVCVRAPCPAFPTTTLHTAGTFSASSRLVKLSPTAPDKRLPEAFDVVRSLHPLPSPVTTNDDGALLPSAGISLLAIERGIDITLTPAAEDCPPGTLKCSKCGVYPPGGVCRAFVCLPPGRRCLPVP